MDNQVKKRLFIALNLPQTVKRELNVIISKLKKKNKHIKWVNSNNIHLTLHFLGYLNADKQEQIKLIMQSFQGKFGELNFEIGKINAFPNLTRPRVIFIECKQVNSKSVYKLHELLGKKLIQLGIKTDKRLWRPHLTLGRVKQDITLNIPDEFQSYLTSFSINGFQLMQSTLKPSGAEYKEIISYKL